MHQIQYTNKLPEGVVIQMKGGLLIVGTKKARTGATVRANY